MHIFVIAKTSFEYVFFDIYKFEEEIYVAVSQLIEM